MTTAARSTSASAATGAFAREFAPSGRETQRGPASGSRRRSLRRSPAREQANIGEGAGGGHPGGISPRSVGEPCGPVPTIRTLSPAFQEIDRMLGREARPAEHAERARLGIAAGTSSPRRSSRRTRPGAKYAMPAVPIHQLDEAGVEFAGSADPGMWVNRVAAVRSGRISSAFGHSSVQGPRRAGRGRATLRGHPHPALPQWGRVLCFHARKFTQAAPPDRWGRGG